MTQNDLDRSGELDFADFVNFVITVRGGMVCDKHHETGAVVKIHHTEFHDQEEVAVQMSALEKENVRMKEYIGMKGLTEEYQERRASLLMMDTAEAIRTAYARDECAIKRIQKLFRGNRVRAQLKGQREAADALTAAGHGLKAAAAPASQTHMQIEQHPGTGAAEMFSAADPFTKEHNKENNDTSWIEQHGTKKDTDDSTLDTVCIGGAQAGAKDPVADMHGQKILL
jgi:hypothetical protein